MKKDILPHIHLALHILDGNRSLFHFKKGKK